MPKSKIELRYRPYKDKNSRGTWLIVNGRQVQRISHRQLTKREQAEYKKRHILTNKGYIQTRQNQFRQQTQEDTIKEVNLGDLNDEVAEIERDPATGKWTKEKVEDRDYVNPRKPEELEKLV